MRRPRVIGSEQEGPGPWSGTTLVDFRHSRQASMVGGMVRKYERWGQRGRHGFICYLLHHNKSPQSLVKSSWPVITRDNLRGSGIWEQLSWVVLGWDLPGGCSQALSRVALIWKLDWGWGIHCQHGSLSQLLEKTSLSTSSRGCLSVLLMGPLTSPRVSSPGETKTETANIYDLASEVMAPRTVIDWGDGLEGKGPAKESEEEASVRQGSVASHSWRLKTAAGCWDRRLTVGWGWGAGSHGKFDIEMAATDSPFEKVCAAKRRWVE